jgi:hypothetical protein
MKANLGSMVDHDVEPVDGVDRLPVAPGRATEGVHAQPEAGAAAGKGLFISHADSIASEA